MSDMRRTFRYDATIGGLVEVVHCAERVAPDVIGDLPDYRSPINGALVSGRAQRRNDLRRNACRPYEAGEREAMERSRAAADAALEKSVDRTVEKFWYDQNSRGRELLEQAMRAGAGVEYTRR